MSSAGFGKNSVNVVDSPSKPKAVDPPRTMKIKSRSKKEIVRKLRTGEPMLKSSSKKRVVKKFKKKTMLIDGSDASSGDCDENYSGGKYVMSPIDPKKNKSTNKSPIDLKKNKAVKKSPIGLNNDKAVKKSAKIPTGPKKRYPLRPEIEGLEDCYYTITPSPSMPKTSRKDYYDSQGNKYRSVVELIREKKGVTGVPMWTTSMLEKAKDQLSRGRQMMETQRFDTFWTDGRFQPRIDLQRMKIDEGLIMDFPRKDRIKIKCGVSSSQEVVDMINRNLKLLKKVEAAEFLEANRSACAAKYIMETVLNSCFNLDKEPSISEERSGCILEMMIMDVEEETGCLQMRFKNN